MPDDLSLFDSAISSFTTFLSWRASYFGVELSNLQILFGLSIMALVCWAVGRIFD